MFSASFFRKFGNFILTLALIGGFFSAIGQAAAQENVSEPRAVPSAPSKPIIGSTLTEIYTEIKSPPSNATYFQVWRSDVSSTSGFVNLGTTESCYESFWGDTRCYYNDNAAIPKTWYWYKWKACNSSGCSGFSMVSETWRLRTLPTPTNVQASQNTYTNKIVVTWDAVEGAAKYAVYRWNAAGETYDFLGFELSPHTDFTDETTSSQAFSYRIQACTNQEYCSYSSTNAWGWIRLATPTWVYATQGTRNSYVTVSWDAVTGANWYMIQRGTDPQGFDPNWTKTHRPGTYFMDEDNVVGTTHYFYSVSACTDWSCSLRSAPVEGWAGYPPAVPTNVSASNNLISHIRVTWDSVSGADYYEAWRFSGSNFVKLGITYSAEYLDYDTLSDTLYQYKITACKSTVGCSVQSSIAQGVRYGPPPPPTNVQATDGDYTDKVVISWNTVPGVDKYQISFSLHNDVSTAAVLTETTNTSYNHLGATASLTYYYWVRSYKTIPGYGEQSQSDSGFKAHDLAPPSNMQASDAVYEDKVRITWDEGVVADYYVVIRNTVNDPSGATLKCGSNSPSVRFCDDTTAELGTVYWYWIYIWNTTSPPQKGYLSPSDSGYRRGLPPPTFVDATDGDHLDKVDVAWPLRLYEEYYRVYRSTQNDPNTAAQIAHVTIPFYSDVDVTPMVTYYYWVTAGNTKFSEGPKSEPDAGYRLGAPNPTDLDASKGTYANKVYITWMNTRTVNTYKIYRSTQSDPGTAVQIAQIPSLPRFYEDTAVIPGQIYYYWISSTLSGTADSPFSDPDTGFSAGGPPSNIQASDGDYPDKVLILWNAVLDAQSYKVYRNTVKNTATATEIAETDETFYFDTNPVKGTLYYYWVTALFGSLNESGYSIPDTGFAGDDHYNFLPLIVR